MNRDVAIRNDVLEELAFDPQIDETAIAVTVNDGVVTLAGHVPTYAARYAAERAAQRVKYVRAVAQDIEVWLPNEQHTDDGELARRAANVLAWSVSPPKEGVKVRVSEGWVTLHGEVSWNYQRDEAERAVRRLAGVKGVTDLITVRNAVRAMDIRDSIRRAFERNADIDSDRIDVTVDGGKVTLSGRVRALSERTAAEHAVWQSPGVVQVVDHLSII